MKTNRHRGGPRGLASTLPRVMKAMLRGRGFSEAGVVTDWPDIVGRPLADFTSPERLAGNGTLYLRVSGGWALEVTHLEPALLDRISGYYGYRAVARLSLLQGPLPVRAESRRPQLRTLSTDEEATLTARLVDAGSPKVRAALEGLGRAIIATSDSPDSDGRGAPGTARNGA